MQDGDGVMLGLDTIHSIDLAGEIISLKLLSVNKVCRG